MLRDQVFQHLLPDIAGELLADERGRRFARAEAREAWRASERPPPRDWFPLNLFDGDGDLQRVLATFN